MLDEGIAREVVNRVQRLRKKAKLQPTDSVTVQYTVEPSNHDLVRVIDQHKEYIENATKNTMVPSEVEGQNLLTEEYELKGAKLTLKIWKSESASNGSSKAPSQVSLKNHGSPQVPFLNVVCESQSGVLLLENPLGCNKIASWQQVLEESNALFGKAYKTLFSDATCSKPIGGNVWDCTGNTIFLTPTSGCGSSLGGSGCPFVDVSLGQAKGSLLLENPVNMALSEHASDVLKVIFNKSVKTLNGKAIETVKWDKLAGQKSTAA